MKNNFSEDKNTNYKNTMAKIGDTEGYYTEIKLMPNERYLLGIKKITSSIPTKIIVSIAGNDENKENGFFCESIFVVANVNDKIVFARNDERKEKSWYYGNCAGWNFDGNSFLCKTERENLMIYFENTIEIQKPIFINKIYVQKI